MRVSIATLYGANNVGAFLQAFSLQTVVEDIVGTGNVEFIRFSANKEKASKIQKVFFYLKHLKVRQLLFKYKTAKKYAEIMPLLHISKEAFSTKNKYDCVIVGSDEVWNLKSNKFVHHEQYFAKNILAKNIIAYAPSAGNSSSEFLILKHACLSGFNFLSARDENTADIIKKVDGRTPEIVCDPTLLMNNFNEYIKPIDEKNYILVYSYGLEKNTIQEIRQYAKINKKKLISVGTYNSWCDKNISVNPIEFLSWLHGADMVVTSTFHGTVLSIKLHKQVAVYSQTSHKINSFLKQVQLEDRKVAKANKLDVVLNNKIDYIEVEKKIDEMRKTSLNFLKDALGSIND